MDQQRKDRHLQQAPHRESNHDHDNENNVQQRNENVNSHGYVEEIESRSEFDNRAEQDEQEVEKEQGEQDTEDKPSETWEWIKALTIAIVIALGIRMFLFAPIVVDGTSMLPTLQDGERLIVNKAIYYITEPERGDILVFHAEYGKDWIKRVIGEPGDTIEVRDDQLYINGGLVEEPYLEESRALEFGQLTNDFIETVPEGHIFVLGDNRQNSRDSRSIGPVPIDNIIGRADVVFWPLDAMRFVNK